MSRTINSVAYSTQSIEGQAAVYGAVVSSVPTTVRFSSISTKQAGVQGTRISRSVQQDIALSDGTYVPVVCTHSVFLPNADGPTATAAQAILASLMSEETYMSGVTNKSLE